MSKHSKQFQMYADAVRNELEMSYQQGIADENNRIIGFLKFNRYAIVDNNGDYYSIEELEDMLRGQSDENNV